MDASQTDHLKAYGVAYHALQKGNKVEWLLNFRGGSFMMENDGWVAKECRLKGVSFEIVAAGDVMKIYKTIQDSNMESVLLEKAPKVGVYIPPNLEPWTMRLRWHLNMREFPMNDCGMRKS